MKVMTKFVSISSDNSIDYNDQDDAEDRKVLTMIIQKKKRKKKEKRMAAHARVSYTSFQS